MKTLIHLSVVFFTSMSLTTAASADSLPAPLQASTAVVTIVPESYPKTVTGSVIVTWAAVAGATSYIVHLNGRDSRTGGTSFTAPYPTCGGADNKDPSIKAIKSVAGRPDIISAKTYFLDRKFGNHAISHQCRLGPDPWASSNPIVRGTWLSK